MTDKRIHEIPEAPTFYPTADEFSDPFRFISKIRHEGEKFGIVKIIPPKSWRPPFALDVDHCVFKTRVQTLNSVDASTRAASQFFENFQKYWTSRGKPILHLPIIAGRPLDFYALKLEVDRRGGHEKVSETQQWIHIGKALNLPKMTSLSHSIKTNYEKLILPYENSLRKYQNKAMDGTRDKSGASGFQSSDLPSSNDSMNEQQAGEHSHITMRNNSPTQQHEDSGSEIIGCQVCRNDTVPEKMLLCDDCDNEYHIFCLDPPLAAIPRGDWYCPECTHEDVGEYGFEDGQDHTMYTFRDMGNRFVETHFGVDATPTEDAIEREFWRLVESPYDSIQVEYGADLHSSRFGSGFPTTERFPMDPYSSCTWNLTNLPLLGGSLFRHISRDISGMIVPWLYMGMCFSTFCWHNEDHYTSSINYLHWGGTKTWYGIAGSDAHHFEQVMRDTVPDLFERQPDVLFHLVTMLSPVKLKDAGVRICKLFQRPGEFVITFPQAYHAGFNQGVNFAEAVNFATLDWLSYGRACVQRYATYHKVPVFSHDELLCQIAHKDTSSYTSKKLLPELKCMEDMEKQARIALRLLYEHLVSFQGKVNDEKETEMKDEKEMDIEVLASTTEMSEQHTENTTAAVPSQKPSITLREYDIVKNVQRDEEEQCCHCNANAYLSIVACEQCSDFDATYPWIKREENGEVARNYSKDTFTASPITSKMMGKMMGKKASVSTRKFACLSHAKEMCACPFSSRILLKRYTDDELCTLITQVETRTIADDPWQDRLKDLMSSKTSVSELRAMHRQAAHNPSLSERAEKLQQFLDSFTAWKRRALQLIRHAAAVNHFFTPKKGMRRNKTKKEDKKPPRPVSSTSDGSVKLLLKRPPETDNDLKDNTNVALTAQRKKWKADESEEGNNPDVKPSDATEQVNVVQNHPLESDNINIVKQEQLVDSSENIAPSDKVDTLSNASVAMDTSPTRSVPVHATERLSLQGEKSLTRREALMDMVAHFVAIHKESTEENKKDELPTEPSSPIMTEASKDTLQQQPSTVPTHSTQMPAETTTTTTTAVPMGKGTSMRPYEGLLRIKLTFKENSHAHVKRRYSLDEVTQLCEEMKNYRCLKEMDAFACFPALSRRLHAWQTLLNNIDRDVRWYEKDSTAPPQAATWKPVSLSTLRSLLYVATAWRTRVALQHIETVHWVVSLSDTLSHYERVEGLSVHQVVQRVAHLEEMEALRHRLVASTAVNTHNDDWRARFKQCFQKSRRINDVISIQSKKREKRQTRTLGTTATHWKSAVWQAISKLHHLQTLHQSAMAAGTAWHEAVTRCLATNTSSITLERLLIAYASLSRLPRMNPDFPWSLILQHLSHENESHEPHVSLSHE